MTRTKLADRLAAITPAVPSRKERPPVNPLALQRVHGNLTFTASTVTAWFQLAETDWMFRSDGSRESQMMAIAEQYGSLVGTRVHLRRTTRPVPIAAWLRATAERLPVRRNAAGQRVIPAHLYAAGEHLRDTGYTENLTFLGVEFARRTIGDLAGQMLRRFTTTSQDGELDRIAEQVQRITNVVALREGLNASPASADDLTYLLYRSVGLGLQAPQFRASGFDAEDIYALTEQVERRTAPFGSVVEYTDVLTGVRRYTAVLTVGRMEPQRIPQVRMPWLHLADTAGFPVEISCRMDLVAPEQSAGKLEQQLRIIRGQQRHYGEHTMDSPAELQRLADRAVVVEDEINAATADTAVRAHGWMRLAVSGDTRKECLDRAAELRDLFRRHGRIDLQHPKDQDRLADEFIPGQPLANTGYLRRMPVTLLAAAMPNAAPLLGDERGDLIGHTCGVGVRPVFYDPHFPNLIRDRSGIAVAIAEPGGGKSTLMGTLAYLQQQRGSLVTILDPSGPLARLAQMPRLRGQAKVLNLGSAAPGTLAPYALVPTPQRTGDLAGDLAKYEDAVNLARHERRTLVIDLCQMLLPPQMLADGAVAGEIRHAVHAVAAEETTTLEDVLGELGARGPLGAEISQLIKYQSDVPLARLFFGRPPADALSVDAALTVITMGGLQLPDPKTERETWSAEELLAVPVLHAAYRLAVRRCYGADQRIPKWVGLDEAHFLGQWPSGKAFLIRLSRDSRKWNIAGLIASQNPQDLLALQIQNLVTTVFVGRIVEDRDVAAGALKLLRLPDDAAFDHTLATLSTAHAGSTQRLPYREFVMRDVDGRIQKMRVDLSYIADLLDVLDTNPGADRCVPR